MEPRSRHVGTSKGFAQSPASGTLSLNPTVERGATEPECPDCGEAIRRVDGGVGDDVEFRCGCPTLKRFEIAAEARE